MASKALTTNLEDTAESDCRPLFDEALSFDFFSSLKDVPGLLPCPNMKPAQAPFVLKLSYSDLREMMLGA